MRKTLLLALIAGAGLTVAPATPALAVTPVDYLALAAPAGQNVQQQYDIPASVAIAQSILESGWGGSRLTVNDRNYYGFKCTSASEPGPIATGCHDYQTTECTPTCHTEHAYFRVYASATDSFRDYGRLLTTSSAYASALPYRHEPDRFIQEVGKHYATDPDYAAKVINLMNTYDLYQFDLIGQPSPIVHDGVLRVFARGTDGALWQNIWNGTTWSWQEIGGQITSGPSAVVFNGTLRVFARGADGTLKQHIWTGSAWTVQDLGGQITSTPSAVVHNGMLRVFARGTDGSVWQNAWNGTAWNWQEIGGRITSAPSAVTQGTQLRVYARGTDGNLWQDTWNGTTWTWQQVGAAITSAPSAVVYNNAVRVFVRTGDGTLRQHIWNGSAWSTQSVGGQITGAPAAVVHGTQLRVYARGTDGSLWQNTWNGSAWTWQDLNGQIS